MTVAPASVLRQLTFGAAPDSDGVGHGTATAIPAVCHPASGVLRTSILATWADMITGMVASQAILPRIPLTLDLETQVVRPVRAGTNLTIESRPVKAGRSVTVTDARFTDAASGELVAFCLASYVASPDPGHTFSDGFPPITPSRRVLDIPIAQRVDVSVVRPGLIEMPRRTDALNATGAIQGGMVALAAEEAAVSLQPDSYLQMLGIRYLRPFSIGPALAEARSESGAVTIELTDAGAGELAAVATARLAPAPTI